MFRKALTRGFLLLLLAARITTAAERPWLEVRSPNFIVVSNAGEKQARRAAGQFERIRIVFQKAFKVRVDPGKPIVILALRDEKWFKEMLPGFFEQKDAVRRAGVFQAGQEKHFVAMRMDVQEERAFHTVYHEYVHMLVNLNFPSIPLWLNEGLAEFYGNSIIRDKDVDVGTPSVNSLRVLQQGRILPLQTLFAVDHSSAHYNENEKASVFYAESWALMHYFIFADKSQKLRAFLMELAKETPAADAAARTLGDSKDLERKLEEYVRRSSYSYMRVKLPVELDESAFQIREMTAAESAAARGDFMLHTNRLAEARVLLEEAVRLNPALPAACESMGLLYLRSKERAKAVEWFEKAAKLDSRSCLAHYYYGAHLLVETASRGASDSTAEQELKKSIELNKEFAPAYSALAGLYSRNRERMTEAVEPAVQAVKLEPANVFYRTNLGHLLINLNRFAEAQHVGETIVAVARTPNEREMAQHFLEQVKLRQAAAAENQQLARQIAEARRQQEAADRAAANAPATPASTPERPAPTPEKNNRPGTEEENLGKRGPNMQTATGTVGKVDCQVTDAMAVTLKTGQGNVLLHAQSFRTINYSSLTWQPPDPFLPCTQLEGLSVRIKYYPLTGTRFAGEISAIEVLKGR